MLVVLKTTIHLKKPHIKSIVISIGERLSESCSSCPPLLISVSFFTRRYNVLWEHHKFIGLIGQFTSYQNLNVSTREKTTLTTQINSDCHITWLSLILIDYLEKDRNSTGSRDVLNTTELDSVHALQYIYLCSLH